MFSGIPKAALSLAPIRTADIATNTIAVFFTPWKNSGDSALHLSINTFNNSIIDSLLYKYHLKQKTPPVRDGVNLIILLLSI
jgi:hypothetical protein